LRHGSGDPEMPTHNCANAERDGIAWIHAT
jgi:hypothetical protein